MTPSEIIAGETYWWHDHSFVYEVRVSQVNTPYVHITHVANGSEAVAWAADLYATEQQADNACLEWLKHRLRSITKHPYDYS